MEGLRQRETSDRRMQKESRAIREDNHEQIHGMSTRLVEEGRDNFEI